MGITINSLSTMTKWKICMLNISWKKKLSALIQEMINGTQSIQYLCEINFVSFMPNLSI